MPRDNAARVITGAQALSPTLGERMVARRLLDKPVFIRELMPQDLKLEVETLSPKQAQILAGYLASVVGRAHGRQWMQPDAKPRAPNYARRNARPSMRHPGCGQAWLIFYPFTKPPISTIAESSRWPKLPGLRDRNN